MIRSELDVLLERVEDTALRADLRTQIDRLQQRRSFGLVFEQHVPERVRLPQHPIRVGSQVVRRDDDDSPTFEVLAIEDGVATLERVRDADGANLTAPEHAGEDERATINSLVVIADFGEPVLPGFRHDGSVERGGDKPYHVVVKGENYQRDLAPLEFVLEVEHEAGVAAETRQVVDSDGGDVACRERLQERLVAAAGGGVAGVVASGVRDHPNLGARG
jgi:hypothetical protein